MIQSIYSGISGLQSFQKGIDVLANNIANVNTVGFKGSSTEFSNLFEASVSGVSSITSGQSGVGVKVSATALDLSLGSYFQTESATDLAIVGDDGWFGVVAGEDEYFTRAGNFNFEPYTNENGDTNLRLTTTDGYFVTGTLANNTNNGVLNPIVEVLELDLANIDAQAALSFPADLNFPVVPSTQANFFGNLGTEDLPQVVSAAVISPQNERNSLRLVFTQTNPQPVSGISWDIVATTQSPDGSTVFDTQNGIAIFDNAGALVSSTLPSLNNNGAQVTANLGIGFSGLASNNGPSIVSSATVDGALAGDLLNYTVNRNGEVISTFTNGIQSVVGKVAIYHFQNDQGLEATSGNRFRVSENSGNPIFYDENNGQILANTLETSNVSLDTALTELIIMQRSYDATAKTVSTADQLLQNALQMDA